jgi:hypothetical protein
MLHSDFYSIADSVVAGNWDCEDLKGGCIAIKEEFQWQPAFGQFGEFVGLTEAARAVANRAELSLQIVILEWHTCAAFGFFR